MRILVTGSNGQLGMCIRDFAEKHDEYNEYFFLGREELDITNENDLESTFSEIKPDFVINCAAYTNVSKAEEDKENAILINYFSTQKLVDMCRLFNCYLIHISTDFVFDGAKKTPYKETDSANPINVYGSSKLMGEGPVLNYSKGVAIRTSWLYSEHGKNFYKTMLGRIKEGKETEVVNDQIGTPTYAGDLALFIIANLVHCGDLTDKCGLYHFSNQGSASWYDFASAIESIYDDKYNKYDPVHEDNFFLHKRSIIPTTTRKYKDKVKRPKYSVLDKTKVEETFNIRIPHWTASLYKCFKNESNQKNDLVY